MCQYANGSTFCKASGEGLCSIDGSSTSQFAYYEGSDRDLVERVAQSNATGPCFVGHEAEEATFGCFEESGGWICMAHARCIP